MNDPKMISVIWIICGDIDKNETTLKALENQKIDKSKVELIICPLLKDGEKEIANVEPSKMWGNVITLPVFENKAKLLNATKEHISGRFVVCMDSGDTFSNEYMSEMFCRMNDTKVKIGISQKIWSDRQKDTEVEPMSVALINRPYQVMNLNSAYQIFPYFVAGTWIDAQEWKNRSFLEDRKYEWEKAYFSDLTDKNRKGLYVNTEQYVYANATETTPVCYQPFYEREWYYDVIDEFWVPLVKKYEGKKIPKYIQYQIMFALDIRIKANLNNTDKHCVPVEEAYEYLWNLERILKYIDNDVIVNKARVEYNKEPFYIYKLYLIIKNKDENIEFDRYYLNGKEYFGLDNILILAQNSQKLNIQYIEYKNNTMYIDGTLSGIYDIEKGKLFAVSGDKKYEVKYNGRYSHIKVFGVSIYKRHPLRVEIPIEDKKEQRIEFRYSLGGSEVLVDLSFDSHTSMLSRKFRNSYWRFDDDRMAVYRDGIINIQKTNNRAVFIKEIKLWINMLSSLKKESLKFFLVRLAYWVMKPIWGRKPVWMYFDKIYKGGDSSEYLFKYACGKKDGIKHYYLVDKKCADYKRLKKEGYGRHLLKRKSIKHRLMFLYSQMMVVSNSTVFAFNDYSMSASAHVRDLIYFNVCCVQHGMSVQKIAIAQNRLRDNTKLYFCASKYELENLNRPIYDYEGYDALKLTGVPRYDGLKSDDKRQILISPTWRMQAAVPVSKNEGVQRDYNPLFKESAYYRVFNSLINDERLLDAAKKYNYRIHYVLHPIVSAQADDFDKNEYVDIIPSVGDMSYEKEFRESSLMVSDYSGVQFDFAYMRKPVVYLHHDDIPQHYEEGTFHYDTMAFGEICHNNDELIDLLIEYMSNDCKMKPEYVARADDFFHYDDHNNCERIYDVMIDYAKNLSR